MTTIKGQLSSFELETRYEAAADPVEKSHLHALWLLSSGYEVANCCFATIESLDQAVSNRCVALVQQPDTIRDNALFHCWPCQRAKK